MVKDRLQANCIVAFCGVSIISCLIVLHDMQLIRGVAGSLYSTKRDGKGINVIDRLKKHVRVLSHEIGDRSAFEYDNLRKSSVYIETVLKSFGYTVEIQKYQAYSRDVENIIAEKRGNVKPNEILIVGAHYDTCGNPGADDNASAVAGLLEIARLLQSEETKRTLRFIAFVNEEPPFFKTHKMGSYVYASSARRRGDDIRAVVILEMIGYYTEKPHSQKYPPFLSFFYPHRGNFIAVVGNVQSRKLVKYVKGSFGYVNSFPVESLATVSFVPGVDFSDHWSFWQMDYPAVMVTDTAFYRNPHYHRYTDTYDTLDYRSMARVVRGLFGVLKMLAQKHVCTF